jgi:hypothetical protein
VVAASRISNFRTDDQQNISRVTCVARSLGLTMRNRNIPKTQSSSPGIIADEGDARAGRTAISEEDAQPSQLGIVDMKTPRKPLTRRNTKERIIQTSEGLDTTEKPPRIKKRPLKYYKRVIFSLGCLVGMVFAWAFRSPDIQLEGLLDSIDMGDFFDDIKAALPSALPYGIMKEAKEIQEHSRQSAKYSAFSIGDQLSQEGLSAHYPVIMVKAR